MTDAETGRGNPAARDRLIKNCPTNQEDNEDERQNAGPTDKMYLPDLNNTPLSQALKIGLDYGVEDKVMVECPKLKQYFGSGHLPCPKNIWTDLHIHPR